MKDRREISRGFTLIEAVLAIAIMSISAFALLAATSQCLAVASKARSYHIAVSVMDQGLLENPLIKTNEVDELGVDEYQPLENGFVFSRVVEELEDEEDLFVLRTRVTWSRRGKQSFEEVATYLYSTNHP